MNTPQVIWQLYADQIAAALWEHLLLTFSALLAGCAAAIPLGLLLARKPGWGDKVILVASVTQTIPSLALFALALPLIGIGFAPAFYVLWLYALFPILNNTYTAMKHIDPALLKYAEAMGMTERQRYVKVRFPLALPAIVGGVRLSAVYTVSWATVAALIGAGGLGKLIFSGIDNYNPDLILAGALPTAILAIMIGWLLGLLQRRTTPRYKRREALNR
ncbi:ABC transporter permease [Paenibacillus thermotolerans]|uniref:ABC transporter permease n=1 Tax=Paenibacillus thermotolerans TaxID=3027807 RepID=UPI0023674C22|nr:MULTISPECIES: ABC transporter permease [unclassified Paenibacillus]